MTTHTSYGAVIQPEGVLTHKESACKGHFCVIHNPSDHKMAAWTIFIRTDKYALAERICEHGIGHPDPDSLAFFSRVTEENFAWAMGVHGCDGCCQDTRLAT